MFSIAIFLAAMGITLLEMSEATAVGIALFAESKKAAVFIAVILGVLVIFVPTAFIGKYITLLPIFYVRLISAVLLLYFGIRLIRSSNSIVLQNVLNSDNFTIWNALRRMSLNVETMIASNASTSTYIE